MRYQINGNKCNAKGEKDIPVYNELFYEESKLNKKILIMRKPLITYNHGKFLSL